MFIKSTSGYTRDGQQRASGLFLMVFNRGDSTGVERRELRALVRHVAMHQLGHWMMARVAVQVPTEPLKRTLSLSGSYGCDGLPMQADDTLWQYLTPLPPELQEAFWNGGGHNSSGSEGPAMHAWALANVAELRQLKVRTAITDEQRKLMVRAINQTRAYRDELDVYIHAYEEVFEAIGVSRGGRKLPATAEDRLFEVDGVRWKLRAMPQRGTYVRWGIVRKIKSSTARLLICCPCCGEWIPAGRMHQHAVVHGVGKRQPRRVR